MKQRSVSLHGYLWDLSAGTSRPELLGWSSSFTRLKTPKEAVCVLRPPCYYGSCLLAGASIPVQLDLGATLPDAGRTKETTKKHKMNRQSNQPKTGGSTPARRHLLLPSLDALGNRGSSP
ncbi:Crooked Neck-Like Protein 1 [Manis pentadactyla]|nr:Crooked Neck-Like Protein 1 [Manis pentadactyla]